MTDHDRLRRLAEQATPGPWTLDRDERTVRAERTTHEGNVCEGTILWDDSLGEGPPELMDGEFIAAWNPATALNLLNELRDAKADAWDEASEYYGVGQADVRDGKQDNPYREETP